MPVNRRGGPGERGPAWEADGRDDGGDGTVGKALDVLDMVAAFGRPVRFTELLDGSAVIPRPRSTASCRR